MDNKKKVKVRAVPSYMILVYLMVATFVLTGVSFARFGNTKTAEDAARAATFEVTMVSAPQNQIVDVQQTEDGVQTAGNYIFTITSTSEVPITYTVTTDTTGAAALRRGVELTLTSVNNAEERERVMSGKKIDGRSATHRPNDTTHIHNFVGVGTAPAGTHTQEFVLNFHYTPDGSAGASTTVVYDIWDGIKIKAVARDGRDTATYRTSEGNAKTITYTDPYTPEE